MLPNRTKPAKSSGFFYFLNPTAQNLSCTCVHIRTCVPVHIRVQLRVYMRVHHACTCTRGLFFVDKTTCKQILLTRKRHKFKHLDHLSTCQHISREIHTHVAHVHPYALRTRTCTHTYISLSFSLFLFTFIIIIEKSRGYVSTACQQNSKNVNKTPENVNRIRKNSTKSVDIAILVYVPYIRTMAKDIDINVSDAIYKLRREFRDLATSQFNLAVARAINHTIAKAKTAASKDIRGQYKVKAKDLSGKLAISKATRVTQTGMIRVSAKPLPIVAFGARQTRKGVSVNITGKRKVIKSAFIATMKSGHKGVFVRGAYKGSELTYRTKRIKKKGADLPIEEVHTASPYSMMIHESVQEATATNINTSFPARLLHELKRM